MKGLQSCKRLLRESWDKTQTAKGFTKSTARSESASVVLEAVLHDPAQKGVSAILQRPVMMDFSQAVFFSGKDVPKHAEHCVGALHG